MSFSERHEDMGLLDLGNSCYHYADRYGEVVYRQVKTMPGGIEGTNDNNIPAMALFTKGIAPESEFNYCGIVSDEYKFMGHDDLNDQIRQSITDIGSPILRENNFMSLDLTKMHNEIVISNVHNIPEQGDVYPQIIIRNTYDGSGKADIAFGICMDQGRLGMVSFGFRQKISSMKQIHIANSTTRLTAAVGGYVNTFAQNITELIRTSFNNHLSEEEMLSVLDLVENVGKKRREGISNILESLTNRSEQGIQSWSTSAWNLFLAITRFSAVEKNLNAKLMLESVAERVLTVPPQMMNTLDVLEAA